LFSHAVTSKLTISYHANVIEWWNAFCNAAVIRLQPCSIKRQWSSGERHENLSADDADRYTFDRDSLHFGARTAIENASAMIALLKA
jgi:hypothetical protein